MRVCVGHRAPLVLDGETVTTKDQWTKLVDDGVRTPDGIAFDWVNKNLYWTDTGHNTIGVLSVKDRHHRFLFNTNLEEPRAIVVDPRDLQG